MKRIIFLLLIFAACQSDPVSEPTQSIIDEKVFVWDGISEPIISGNRSGLQPLFYKESLTTDNWTMFPQQRAQRAYNKQLVDSVSMRRYGNEIVNVNYVDHGYYDVKIKFIGEPYGSYTRYLSVLGANVINYKPYGANVLHSTNKSRITSLLFIPDWQPTPGWELGRYKRKYKYVVMLDSDTLGVDYFTPNSITGNGVTMPHK